MEHTPWKLPHGTYTTLSYVMELTAWKLPPGTYTMEGT